MRIGQGFDAHAFKDEGGLILGGVTIPYHKGMAAHSDGDVVLHALCDAILGASALGDIGKHFPDNDPQYSGIDSRILLRHVMQLVQNQGYRVGNADLTIVAQAPKLAPFIDDMREHIAADLNVAINQINVKATTTEHMGFTGRKEGIAAFAVVILNQV